jgi:hypothetical protein
MRTLTQQELLDLVDGAAEMEKQQGVGTVEGRSPKSRHMRGIRSSWEVDSTAQVTPFIHAHARA